MKRIELARGDTWFELRVDGKRLLDGHRFTDLDFIKFMRTCFPEIELDVTEIEDWEDDDDLLYPPKNRTASTKRE